MNPTRPYHWLCLLAAIVFEVAGTTVMKLSFGWSFGKDMALEQTDCSEIYRRA